MNWGFYPKRDILLEWRKILTKTKRKKKSFNTLKRSCRTERQIETTTKPQHKVECHKKFLSYCEFRSVFTQHSKYKLVGSVQTTHAVCVSFHFWLNEPEWANRIVLLNRNYKICIMFSLWSVGIWFLSKKQTILNIIWLPFKLLQINFWSAL